MAHWLMQGREYQGDGDPNGAIVETRGAAVWIFWKDDQFGGTGRW